MIRKICIAAALIALAAPAASAKNQRVAYHDANGNLDALIAQHAAANNLPEDLLRRVIKRESGGNPRVVSRGNYGLMQIKLATARSMGYTGTATGLLDADTNMTYAAKYLAGAYHVAGGSSSRAVHYYAAGYYYAAKRKGGVAQPSETALNTSAPVSGGRAIMQYAAQAEGPSASPASPNFGARLND
jgi:soluble lytic murein transglycosylase-like protein